MNEKWECYLCAREDKFDSLPNGYLGNYHPLCFNCANIVLGDKNHPDRFRLTYHSDFGDLKIVNNIPVQDSYLKKN